MFGRMPPQQQSHHPLQIKAHSAFVWSALVGILFFGWASWDLSVSRKHTLQAAQVQAINSAQLVARSMDSALSQVDLVLRQVLLDHGAALASGCIQNQAVRSSKLNHYLARELALIPESQSLRASGSDNHFCFDATGKLSNVQIGDRAYVRQHRNHPRSGLVISEPILAKVTHNWVITISRQLPRPTNNQYAGQLQAALNASFFANTINQTHRSDGQVIGIIGSSDRLMARWPPLPNTTGKPMGSPFLVDIRQGYTTGSYQRISNLDQVPRIYGWSKSRLGLVALVGLSQEQVLQPWWARLRAEVLFCLLATCVWSMIFWSWRRHLLEAQRRQHSAQAHATALLDSLPEMAWFRAASGEYLSANAALETLVQHPDSKVYGLSDQDIWPESAADSIRQLAETALEERRRTSAEIKIDQHGCPRLFEVSCMPAQSGDAVAGIARDVTEYRQRQAQLRKLAETDQLTKLPNRRVAEKALASLSRPITLLFVDLDRFKTVNDTLGHHLGDRLLVQASQRLRKICQQSILCSRLGGDEFLIMTANQGKHAASVLAEELLLQLSQPYLLGAAEISLGASIGIARYPEDASNGEALLMAADSAMYAAKASGRQTACFYTPAMGKEAHDKMEMEAQLRRALGLQQIHLHYQPQLTPQGQVKGFEALMRWTHPTLGQVPPSRFIPLAEECGMIGHLGTWALQQAAEFSAQLRRAGFPSRVSVNVSAIQLVSYRLAETIQSAVECAGARLSDFEIEVTESMLMQSPQHAREELERIQALGVAVAMDDFGTGFSSLGQLADLPISRIKMDRSFVTGLPDKHDAAALAKTICDLGHRLDLPIVAEGVETQPELDFLQNCGCHEIQGFFFARPMPEQEVLAWLRQSLRTDTSLV